MHQPLFATGARAAQRRTAARFTTALLLGLAPLAWGQALWLDAAGRPGPAAQEAVQWLVEAEREGLRPADYGAGALTKALALAQALDQLPLPGEAARLDATLTQAVLRYLHELRDGRVAAAQIHARYDSATAPAADLDTSLREAVARGTPADALRAATPPWPQYPALRQALARYRALTNDPAWQQPLPAPPGGKLVPGQAWVGVPALAARLQALGDLPPGAEPASTTYSAELQQAVLAFQARHGLAVDGVVARATLDALAVPPAARAQQIALAMERLRLTPLPAARRFLTVNVPEFMLRAYEHDPALVTPVQPAFEMKVIVGKALDARTPLFDEDLRWVEFSPYWNIPASIARQETLPKLRANPGYLAAQGMEFVGAGGQVSTAVTPEALDAVLAGEWRIRQRPGRRNALGNVKFMLPNNQAIYLHDTNAPGLFARTRRDFSHGCIRVQDPVGLAQWVLGDQPDWTEARIRQSMGRPRPVVAHLSEPVPVLITYSTAIATPGGGVRFVPDLYGLDERLRRALAQPARAAPEATVARTRPGVARRAAGAAPPIAAQSAPADRGTASDLEFSRP